MAAGRPPTVVARMINDGQLAESESGTGPARAPSAESMRGPECPFCGAADAELVSLFGSQLLMDQRRCRICGSYFEAVRGG